MGYNINFIYFGDYIMFMKLLMYGLSLGNILFMIHIKYRPVEKPIAKKIDIEVL